MNRRSFIKTSFAGALTLPFIKEHPLREASPLIMTVNGPIRPQQMGVSLIHEHILVDFIGADQINSSRWNHDEVINKVLPYLTDLRKTTCKTVVDCTPNYLGRDVRLLKKLYDLTGLNIITNTGYYGGQNHKFLPPQVFSETSEQLSKRWIDEWQNGIDGTNIKPGFIKISVNPGNLSEVSVKLITSAALTHLQTGLTIASHTGPALPAFEQLEIIKKHNVEGRAFIWVHAQNEKDWSQYVKACHQGMWVSLDGVNDKNIDEYTQRLVMLKQEKCLSKVLISHDAGWYEPGKPDGGTFKPYTPIFNKLVPSLLNNRFKKQEIDQLLIKNPRNAFMINVKRKK